MVRIGSILWFALFCLLPGNGALVAGEAFPVEGRAEFSVRDVRSFFDAQSGRIVAEGIVTVRNTGDRALRSPFHVDFVIEGMGLDDVSMDGAEVSGANGQYTGRYDVSDEVGDGLPPGGELTVPFAISRSATSTLSYRIEVFARFNRDPLAVASVSEVEVEGVPLSFDGGGSFDPDGGELSYVWDFGDGTTSDEAAPVHAYALPGVYTTRLRVTDTEGAFDETQRTVRILPSGDFALARVRTLDGAGQPLGDVLVERVVDGHAVALGRTEDDSGFFVSEGEPGVAWWRFSREGYLPAWREVGFLERSVALVPSPWMARAPRNAKVVSPLSPAVFGDERDPAALTFPAGAFGEGGEAGFTPLGPQSLPLPLPRGWRPLGAFHLSVPGSLLQAGNIDWRIADSGSGVRAVVRLDENGPEWRVVTVAESGAPDESPVASAGFWVLVAADTDVTAPPVPAVGGTLAAGEEMGEGVPVFAEGVLDPPVGAASLDPAAVTTRARVVFDGDGAMASGRLFRAEIGERYTFAGGGTLRTPDYDTTFTAYRDPSVPGDDRLVATFPLRPTLLFDPSELAEARLMATVLDAEEFDGAILDATGGVLAGATVTLRAPADAFAERTVAELRELDPAGFADLLGDGDLSAERAFQLNGTAGAAPYDVTISGVSPESDFVLARLTGAAGRQLFEPVLRMRSGADGVARSAEPDTEPRLPGVRAAGRYVLIAVPAPPGLISGTARALDGTARAGLLVTVAGQPWGAVSRNGGAIFLVAAAGEGTVELLDPADGNRAAATFSLADANDVAVIELQAVPSGPRVVAVEPAPESTGVSRVTAVRVTFSEPVDAASFGPTGLALLDDEGGAVAATLSLNLARTVAELFPADPLQYDTLYTIVVSAEIADDTGNPLEGETDYAFVTRRAATRGEGAQLTIYEPGALNIPEAILDNLIAYTPGVDPSAIVVHGSQGSADPEVPVILVNESTGETSTVLSQVDGGFYGVINGTEEDFVSATFVNANETRITLPVSRQEFDNGFVGLYRRGGILEAESDGGPVRVLIEPEAIDTRGKFRVDPLPLLELMELVRNTVPEDATLLGGFRFEMEGDELDESATVSFPLDAAQLDLEPGESVEDRAFALTEVIEEDGEVLYNVIDKMRPVDGELVTSSPPFIGLGGFATRNILVVPVMLSFGNQAVVTGKVVQAPDDIPAPTQEQILQGSAGGRVLRPVAGAVVSAYPGGIGMGSGGALRPGAIVSRTNTAGAYSLLFAYDPFANDPVLVEATSFRFPNQRARYITHVPSAVAGDAPIATANVAFRVPAGDGVEDTIPPTVSIRPPSAVLPVNESVEVDVIVRDNLSTPALTGIRFVPDESIPLVDGEALDIGDLAVSPGEAAPSGPRQVRVPVAFIALRSMLATVEATAVDASGNERTVRFRLRFGVPPESAPGELEPSSDIDDEGPRVTLTIPASGGFLPANTFDIFFNEPIQRINPDDGDPVSLVPEAKVDVALSTDQEQMRVTLSGLLPDTEYTLTLNSSALRDLSGNFLESAGVFTFKTPPYPPETLDGVGQVVGTVVDGVYAYSLNRGPDRELVVHKAGVSGEPEALGRVGLPPFPRAIELIPQYRYLTDPESEPRTGTLVVATGGLLGEGSVGPWLWVIDVTDPHNPFRLASRTVTLDAASTVSSVRWSPPYMITNVMTPEGGILGFINLQAFILGNAGYSGSEYKFGVDLTGDGSYVEAGERPPIPQRNTVYGLEFTLPFDDGRLAADFDAAGAGGFLVAALQNRGGLPSRLQVVTFGGDLIGLGGDSLGALVSHAGNFTRVQLDLEFPLTDDSGTQIIPAVIAARGPELVLVDLTDPVNPQEIRSLDVGDYVGSIRALNTAVHGEIALAGTGGLAVIAIRDFGDLRLDDDRLKATLGNGQSGRGLGASARAFTSTTGGATELANRPPVIRVGQILTREAIAAADLAAAAFADKAAYLDAFEDTAFIIPFYPDCDPLIYVDNPEPFDPVDIRLHHYVRVHASGHLGPVLALSAEALDAAGSWIAPRGAEYPPTILTDVSASVSTGQLLSRSAPILARRLSDDPRSPHFNEFLSSPFVVIAGVLTDGQNEAIDAIDERRILHGGQFLRFGFDVDPGAHDDVRALGATLSGRRFVPGLAVTLRSLPLEYVESPNPSQTVLAPRLGPIDLQSGEAGIAEEDYVVEGRGANLSFSRYYASRARFSGILGRNWDFNFNARIIEMPFNHLPPEWRLPVGSDGEFCEEVAPGDVLLIDGMGGVHTFKLISDERGNMDRLSLYAEDPAIEAFVRPDGAGSVSRFFESPKKFYSILVEANDGRFLLIDQQGHRTYFHADGRLDRFVNAHAASRMIVRYRDDGLIDRVEGDRGIAIRFNYYFPFTDPRFESGDFASDEPHEYGKLARLRSSVTSAYDYEVRYEFDQRGNLVRVVPSEGAPTAYAYDSGEPRKIRRAGLDDGTRFPGMELEYDSAGLATGLKFGDREYSFSGAEASGRARALAGGGSVSVSGPVGQATMEVDGRGHLTAFGGKEYDIDDGGRIKSVKTSRANIERTYDEDNPVYRFRGNVVRTERGPDEDNAFVTETTFDGTAYNRIIRSVDVNGDVTEFTFTGNPATGGTGRIETAGPLESRYVLNEYGQVTEEDRSAPGSVDFQRRFFYGGATLGPDGGLKEGELFRQEFSIARDTLGRADRVSEGGAGFELDYTPEGLPRAKRSLDGDYPSLTMSYDEKSRLRTDETERAGQSVSATYTYHPIHEGRRASVLKQETGLPGTLTTYAYSPEGRLISSTVAGETTNFTLDDSGRVVRRQGPGVLREVEYGPGGRIEWIRDQGHEKTLDYDDAGRLVGILSELTRIDFDYDEGSAPGLSERLQSRTVVGREGGETLLSESYTYNGAGLLDTVEDANGRMRAFEYFPDRSERRMTLDGAVMRERERDARGRLIRSRVHQTVTEYGGFDGGTGLPQVVTFSFLNHPAALTSSRSYDGAGRLTGVTTPEGVRTFMHDGFGNVIRREDPDGVVFEQSYAPSRVLLGSTFSDGTHADYTVNALGRVTGIATVNGALTNSFEDGLLRSVTYPDGVEMEILERNEFFKPTTVREGTTVKTYTYDGPQLMSILAGTDLKQYERDALGRVTAIDYKGDILEYEYNEYGEISGEGGWAGDWQQVLDNLNIPVLETYPSGWVLTYETDPFGAPLSLGGSGVQSIDWFAPGMPSRIAYTGGVVVEREYDGDWRMTEAEWTGSGGAVAGYGYGISSGGRILHEERLHDGLFDVYGRNDPGAGMRIEDFYFDASNDEGAGSGASVTGLEFAASELRGIGARSTQNPATGDPRGFMASLEWTGPRPSSIDGSGTQFDSKGNLTRFPVWARLPGESGLTRTVANATYTSFGNIYRISRGDGVTTNITFDGAGRIIRRVVSGPADRCRPLDLGFAWKHDRLIETYDLSGDEPELLRRYIWAGAHLVELQIVEPDGHTAYIPLVTQNGSIGGFLDGEGNLVESIVYGPYGYPVFRDGDGQPVERSSIAQDILFQGQLFCEASGIYFLGKRNLHPLAGIFLQREPEKGLFRESIALFTAFNGDPAGRVDPTGLTSTGIGIPGLQEMGEILSVIGPEEEAWIRFVQEGIKTFAPRLKPVSTVLTVGLAMRLTDQDRQLIDRGYRGPPLNLIRLGKESLQAHKRFEPGAAMLGVLEYTLRRSLVSGKMDNSAMEQKGPSVQIYDVAPYIGVNPSLGPPLGDAIQLFPVMKAAADALSPTASGDRFEKLLSLGSSASTLGREYMHAAIKGDDPNKAVYDQGFNVLSAVVGLAGKGEKAINGHNQQDFRSVKPPHKPAALSEILGDSGGSAVGSTSHQSFEGRQVATLSTLDPLATAEYRAATSPFEKNGGSLTTFPGMGSGIQLDDVIQRIVDYADVPKIPRLEQQLIQVIEQEFQRVERLQGYLNALDAP